LLRTTTGVAISAREADFLEFARVEQADELGLRGRREAGSADFERGFEGLAEAAQLGLLRAGERKVFPELGTHR
jgi:hypothetical protein